MPAGSPIVLRLLRSGDHFRLLSSGIMGLDDHEKVWVDDVLTHIMIFSLIVTH